MGNCRVNTGAPRVGLMCGTESLYHWLHRTLAVAPSKCHCDFRLHRCHILFVLLCIIYLLYFTYLFIYVYLSYLCVCVCLFIHFKEGSPSAVALFVVNCDFFLF